MMKRFALVFHAALALAAFSFAHAASFTGIGKLTGDVESDAAGVSADGAYVVGTSLKTNGTAQAFRYAVVAGTRLGLGAGTFTDSRAAGVSGDGAVIVGNVSSGSSGAANAFVWRASVGLTLLGTGGGGGDAPTVAGVNDEGTIATGAYSFYDVYRGITVQRAVKWTIAANNAASFSTLPLLWDDSTRGMGFAVESPGGGIVGGQESLFGPQGFVSYSFYADGLGDLDGGFFSSEAHAVSQGGAVIVGVSSSANGDEAFVSTGAMTGLGDFAGGAFSSTANDVSADGSQAVGAGTDATGSVAFIWDARTGLRSVRQVLVDAGVTMTGWKLTEATGISGDGNTIVGNGVNPAGKREGWVAFVQTPPIVTNAGGTYGRKVGESFVFQIMATKSPTSYAASGLPTELNFNPTTGAISGTLTSRGIYNVTLSATNGAGTSAATTPVHLVVGEPIITSALSVSGTAELPFTYQMAANQETVLLTVDPATMPDGLALTNGGVISGTPRAEGVYHVTLKVQNVAGVTAADLVLTVGAPALGFVSETSVTGRVGQAFSYQVVATKNPTGYGAVSLPGGLVIDATTGVISGTPSSAGLSQRTITATNGAGTGNFVLTFAIAPANAAIDPNATEQTLGHGLIITYLDALASWDNGTLSGTMKIKNPSASASFAGRVDLINQTNGGPNPLSTQAFASIAAGAEITVPLSGDIGLSGFADKYGAVYAAVFERNGTKDLLQASGLVTEFYTYNTAPPSGGTTQSNSGVNAPGFEPVVLASVAVRGPGRVDEGASADYTVQALMSDGSSFAPTGAVWTSGGFAITSAGHFTTTQVDADAKVTIGASVTVSGVTKSGTKSVTVIDKTPRVTVVATPGTTRETAGAAPGRFVITRTGDMSAPLTVFFKINGNATEGADYPTLPRQATIPAGAASVEIKVKALADATFETDETVKLTLLDGGETYALGTLTNATVTILDSARFKGTYRGLISSNPAALETSGFVKVDLSATGSLTALIRYNGRNYILIAALDNQGALAAATFDGVALTIGLQLDTTGATDGMTGAIFNGGTKVADVTTERAAFSAAAPVPANLVGRYTMVLPGNPAVLGAPKGNGYGTLSVETDGRVTFAGVFGDGTTISQGAALSRQTRWPFYVIPSGKEVALGLVTVRPKSEANHVDGTLDWIKAADAESPYPNGFTTTIPLAGSHYSTPKIGKGPLGSVTNATVTAGANGPFAITLPTATTSALAKGKMTVTGQDGFALKITLATGLFKGTFNDATAGAAQSFKGALLQKQTLGKGVLTLGDGTTDGVELTPAP